MAVLRIGRASLVRIWAATHFRVLVPLDSLLDKAYDMTYHLDIQKPIY